MSKHKDNDSLLLPNIKPKKFDPKEFLKAASKVKKILEQEQEELIKEKLRDLSENNFTIKLF